MIDPTDCKNLKEETAIICPVCLEIPRYPLIFPCGHLECHSCYSTNFSRRVRRWELKFFTPCPVCRSDVIPEKVSTAEVEFKLRPTSKVSIFYNNLQVRCRNRGCRRFILYPLLTLHEKSRYLSLACILIKKNLILLLSTLSLTVVGFHLVYLVTLQ